jgi:8-oxo-dGTP pyrophosphatase MutT (NUDIX family)
MRVVYAFEPFPTSWQSSLFLVGPTPRDDQTPSWRPEALELLRKKQYDGVVFVPESRDGRWHSGFVDYLKQYAWETEGLHFADRIVAWVPRDLVTMPAFTTNHEHGEWLWSGKTVFGAPPEAAKNQYLWLKADEYREPQATTLEHAIDLALADIGAGGIRLEGERCVPLDIWRTPAFQSWYAAQKAAGNRLDRAKVEWMHRVGRRRRVFTWALHVSMFVAAEERFKSNEVVLGRPDISCAVLRGPYRGLDTEIVTVREYRSPGVTPDGFIRELPGGSSSDPSHTPLEVAVKEILEETGFTIEASRLCPLEAGQLVATQSVHRAHLFTAELTAKELAWFRSQSGIQHGAYAEERTFVEVVRLGDLRPPRYDWSTVGMVTRCLLAERL